MSYISVAAPSSEKSNVAGSRRRPLGSSRAVNEKGVSDDVKREGIDVLTGDGGDVRESGSSK